jgi:hypothetical protein
MAMSTPHVNGRERKSLAEQIDRLDAILDGLAEGLNEAVVTAVQAAVGLAVQEAVRGVLTEVLTNPALLAKLRGGAAPAPAAVSPPVAPGKPRLRERFRQWCGRVAATVRAAWQECGRVLHQGLSTCRRLPGRVRRGWARCWHRVQVVKHFRVQLLTALAVGVAAGTAAYWAGPWLAAGVSALGGFATALAVQAGLAVRRLLAPFAASARGPFPTV